MSHDNKLLTPANTAAGLLGMIGLAAGGKTAANVLSDPHFRQKVLDSNQNFLKSFYKRGLLPAPLFQAKQYALAVNEGVKGVASFAMDAMNFGSQQAYNETGLTNRTYNSFKKHLNAFDNEVARTLEELRGLTPGSNEYKKVLSRSRRNTNTLGKKMHAKLTSDYANQKMMGKGVRSPRGRSYYAIKGAWWQGKEHYGKRGHAPYVDIFASAKEAAQDVGKKELKYIKDIWGVGKKTDATGRKIPIKWVKYANVPGLQDAYHGVKFHRPFYQAVLGSLAKDRIVGKPSFDKFKNAAIESGLILPDERNIRMLNNKVGYRRIAINFSPSMKPVYDWGGYNAIGIYDEATNKIKIIPSDKRDLFSMKAGKDTMNYMTPDELDPNSYVKQAEKYYAEEKVPKLNTKTTKTNPDFVGDTRNRGNRGIKPTVVTTTQTGKKKGKPRNVTIYSNPQNINYYRKLVDRHEEISTSESLKKSSAAYKKKFFPKRAMIGKGLLAGLGGAVSLAFLAKEIYDEFNE